LRPLQVERQQSGEDGVLVHGGGVGIVPAVGRPDGAVERGVGVLQSGRTLVVEVGQRPLLQLGFGRALGVELVAPLPVEEVLLRGGAFLAGVGDLRLLELDGVHGGYVLAGLSCWSVKR
jgi:hypothetical protein